MSAFILFSCLYIFIDKFIFTINTIFNKNSKTLTFLYIIYIENIYL